MTTDPNPPFDETAADPPSTHTVLFGAIVIVALVTLGFSLIEPASARFAGTTNNEQSFFEAASLKVELGRDQPAVSSLAFDLTEMYPGRSVERCVSVDYEGSIESVDIRLHGRSDTVRGLDPHLWLEIDRGEGIDADCSDFVASDELFAGAPVLFWTSHGTYQDGIDVLPGATNGQRTVLRIELSMPSDTQNDAQGLMSRFWLTAEARP